MSQYYRLPAASVTATNPSVGVNGTTAPTSSTEVAYINGGGNLTPVSPTNPLPITGTISATNPSVGTNGATAPTSSTEVSGINPSGNLNPLHTDNSNNLLVSVQSVPSNQSVNLAQVGGVAFAEGQTTMSASLPVAIASNQSNVPVSQATASALNATVVQATAANLNAAVVGVGAAGTPSGGVLSIQGVASGTVVPVSGTVTVTSTSANQGTAAALSGAWPVKITDGTTAAAVKAASTAAVAADPAQVVALSPNNNTLANALLTKSTDGTNIAAVKAASTAPLATDPALVVTLSPNSTGATASAGTAIANTPVQNIYSTTNVTTSAYVQLIASTTSVTNTVDIFDSSGQAMILGVGAAGSEVVNYYVPPGGDSFKLKIPAGSRIAIKALTATANTGYILLNLLQ